MSDRRTVTIVLQLDLPETVSNDDALTWAQLGLAGWRGARVRSASISTIDIERPA